MYQPHYIAIIAVGHHRRRLPSSSSSPPTPQSSPSPPLQPTTAQQSIGERAAYLRSLTYMCLLIPVYLARPSIRYMPCAYVSSGTGVQTASGDSPLSARWFVRCESRPAFRASLRETRTEAHEGGIDWSEGENLAITTISRKRALGHFVNARGILSDESFMADDRWILKRHLAFK